MNKLVITILVLTSVISGVNAGAKFDDAVDTVRANPVPYIIGTGAVLATLGTIRSMYKGLSEGRKNQIKSKVVFAAYLLAIGVMVATDPINEDNQKVALTAAGICTAGAVVIGARSLA